MPGPESTDGALSLSVGQKVALEPVGTDQFDARRPFPWAVNWWAEPGGIVRVTQFPGGKATVEGMAPGQTTVHVGGNGLEDAVIVVVAFSPVTGLRIVQAQPGAFDEG